MLQVLTGFKYKNEDSPLFCTYVATKRVLARSMSMAIKRLITLIKLGLVVIRPISATLL